MIGTIERRFEMPDALELPRMLRAVVPLMRARHAIVNEFVALALGHAIRRLFHPTARRLPSFPAIARTLNDLPEPGARLRRVDSVRINRRPFDVINFPARKMRPVHFP